MLVSYFASDMCISFDVNVEIDSDVLIRCRHLSRTGSRVTIFRIMFHTAFIPEFNLRFSKSDLDFANSNSNFSDDFMVDFFYSKSQDIEEEKSLQFWHSIEKSHESRILAASLSESGEEEEKIDRELMEKYRHKLEDVEGEAEEDDIEDYLAQLEAKSKAQSP